MNWYTKVLRQFADFNGRARRMEYWMFTLVNIIITFSFLMMDNRMGLSIFEFDGIAYGYLTLLYSLAVFIPSLAVTVRRLHDIGKSGWWYLVGLIPFIGGIWLLFLLVKDGLPQENEYGPNPKA